MIKQHKKMLILTSVITLLPIFIGLLLWRQLPASVATHFGVDNQPDGYCSKAFAVFGLPVMMLFFHLICIVATNIDPKRKNISKKVFHVVMWICPVISLVNCNILYVYNLGYKLNIGFVCGLFVGILYLILGNFIPKVKPNYSIGFRIPWALNDSDNWYHTHRFGGKCMVIGGNCNDCNLTISKCVDISCSSHCTMHSASSLFIYVLSENNGVSLLYLWIESTGLPRKIVRLPVYFIRKKKNPDDKRNTIIRLIVLSFAAVSIFVLLLGSGLIIMYFQDLFS